MTHLLCMRTESGLPGPLENAVRAGQPEGQIGHEQHVRQYVPGAEAARAEKFAAESCPRHDHEQRSHEDSGKDPDSIEAAEGPPGGADQLEARHSARRASFVLARDPAKTSEPV